MPDLKRKNVVVTGAGSGIGAAIAERLAADGARVVVSDLNEEAAGDAGGDERPYLRTEACRLGLESTPGSYHPDLLVSLLNVRSEFVWNPIALSADHVHT